jgi:hypothetical protein
VARATDPGGAVNICADVATLMEERFTAVQAGANPDRAGESLLDLCDGGHPVAGGREGAEERVTLGVDLDAAVVGERCADDALMVRERLGVGVGAELVE